MGEALGFVYGRGQLVGLLLGSLLMGDFVGLSLRHFEYCRLFLWELGVGDLVGPQEGRSWSLAMGDAVGFLCELGQMLRLRESSSSECAGFPVAVLELALSAAVTGV